MIFCIPVLPKIKADNWPLVGYLLNGTLRSLAAQTDQTFEVLIAAHGLPPNVDLQGLSITVVEPDWKPSLLSMRDPYKDKRLKRRLLGAEVRRRGGGHVMLLDADDRVSNRLVEAVRAGDALHGYIIERGYAYDFWQRIIAPIPGAWPNPFYGSCGSCAVFNFAVEDLPEHAHEATLRYYDAFRSHRSWKDVADQHGRPLQNLPFPGAVYFQNTGENTHDRTDRKKAAAHQRELRAAQIPLTSELAVEFSLDDDLLAIRQAMSRYRPSGLNRLRRSLAQTLKRPGTGL